MNWVRINKLSELSGLSKNAIYGYMSKGTWREGVHYRRPPNNRCLYFNIKAIEKWVEGRAA